MNNGVLEKSRTKFFCSKTVRKSGIKEIFHFNKSKLYTSIQDMKTYYYKIRNIIHNTIYSRTTVYGTSYAICINLTDF